MPSMIAELARIRAKLAPATDEQRGGFLLVPEGLTRKNGSHRLKSTMLRLEIHLLIGNLIRG